MGGSSSKSSLSIENNVLVVNKQNFEMQVENIAKLAIKEVMKASQTCNASTIQIQDIDVLDVTARDGSTITLDQAQKSNISLQCIQVANMKSSFSAEIVGKMMADLASDNNQEVMAKIAAQAESEAVNDSLGMPGAEASSETNIEVKNNIQQITDIHKKIQVKMERVVERELKTETINEIISSAIQIQKQRMGNLLAERNSKIIVGQSQAADTLVQATMTNGVIGDTIIAVMEDFGVKNTDSVKQKGTSDISAEAKSKSENKGLGDMITGIFDAFANMGIVGVIGSIISIVACLCLCGFSLYMLFKPSSQATVGKLLDIAPGMMSKGMETYGQYKSLNNGYGDNGGDEGGQEEGGQEDYGNESGQYGGGVKGFITNLVKFIALK
jgi:hypothetical protein